MNWNYRVVNTKTQNSGEDWYCLQEVFYNDKGIPCGYSDPCTGSETMEDLRVVWKMMEMALLKAPMQEEDFVGTLEDDDEGEDDE
jgi:hypothetical protein